MGESLPSGTGANRLLARFAHSAEYSIAAALIAVCAVVGGALWLLRPQEDVAEPAAPSAISASSAPAVDEREAIDKWKRKLGEELGALDETQRRRAAEEDVRRARQRGEEAAAEARRQADLAAIQARQQAETKARAQAALSRPAPAPTPAPRRRPVIVDAAIDWSSCRRPAYPRKSLELGHEGVVTVAVDLDAAANIELARVSQSSGHATLDRVTLDAVRRCRFTPAQEDGVAKAGTAAVRFVWKLEK